MFGKPPCNWSTNAGSKGRKSAIVIEGNGPLIAGVRALATVMHLASQRRAQRIFAYLKER